MAIGAKTYKCVIYLFHPNDSYIFSNDTPMKVWVKYRDKTVAHHLKPGEWKFEANGKGAVKRSEVFKK